VSTQTETPPLRRSYWHGVEIVLFVTRSRERSAVSRAIAVLFLVAALFAAIGTAAAAADTGMKIAFLSQRSGDREIYTINPDGTAVKRLTFNSIFERAPRWSPNGSKLVFTGVVEGNADIYTINADGTGLQRLTTDPARDDDPSWTGDGTRIVYDRGLFSSCTPCGLRVVNADGTNDHELSLGPGDALTPDASPHGNQIVFSSDRSGRWLLYTASANGGSVRQVTSDSPGGDFDPRWSSDGNSIAFERNNGDNTDTDLYTVHANAKGLRQLTNTPSRAEFQATWSPDDSQLIFFADGKLFTIHEDGTAESAMSTNPKAPLDETFNDGIVDSSVWHTINDSGGTIGEVNGRLEAFISHDADPSVHNYNQVDEHIGSQCTLNGNFDFQVDYELVTWPSQSGFFAMLNAIFGDGAIARHSATWAPGAEEYNSWTNGATFTNDVIPTNDMTGQMRLVRTEGVMRSYERHASSDPWTLVHTGDANGNTVAAIGLWAPGNDWTHQDGRVAYDNFRFNSGAFTCPSWWSDAWPDWQAPPGS